MGGGGPEDVLPDIVLPEGGGRPVSELPKPDSVLPDCVLTRVELCARVRCVIEGKHCTIHNTALINKKTRTRKWTKCKDGLFRNTYRIVQTWSCPGLSPEKIKKPVQPDSVGKSSSRDSIIQGRESTFTFSGGSKAKRARGC